MAESHRNNSPSHRLIGYGFLGIIPWVLLYVVTSYYKTTVRAAKDPSLYSGTCYKPNGYGVSCTLDQWLLWDATPLIDVVTLVGAILAAAVSGLTFLKYMRLHRR